MIREVPPTQGRSTTTKETHHDPSLWLSPLVDHKIHHEELIDTYPIKVVVASPTFTAFPVPQSVCVLP